MPPEGGNLSGGGYGDADWPDLLTAFNGKSITYDAIGNPLNDGTWTYTWQHGRQLASMSKSGSSIAYGYNADGKRISKTVDGATYNYSYLGDQLTEMTWGSNKLHFTYDSIGPASVTYNGTTYFYLKNAQGDVTGLVNASGTQVVSYTYDPWGVPMSVSGTMASTLGAVNPLRYRGYVYDTETGLYYLSSRYYNPTWGRFVNADTAAVVAASPDKANWDKNLFTYCDNNPVNRQDDEGNLWKWSPFMESHDWGYAHMQVEAAIILKYGTATGIISEAMTDVGTRMDIYKPDTGEVWEIKPYSNGRGFMNASLALTEKYVGKTRNNVLIKMGSANAFSGTFVGIIGGHEVIGAYWTPQPGVILYDFCLNEPKRQSQSASDPAEAPTSQLIPILPVCLPRRGYGSYGRGGMLRFGGGGLGIHTMRIA